MEFLNQDQQDENDVKNVQCTKHQGLYNGAACKACKNYSHVPSHFWQSEGFYSNTWCKDHAHLQKFVFGYHNCELLK